MENHQFQTTLGEIASFRRGVSYKGSELAESEADGTPMINMKSFTKEGKYRPEGIKFHNGIFKEKNLIKPDEIVIANTDLTKEGDILGAAIMIPVELHGRSVVGSHHTTILTVNDERVDPTYLTRVINSVKIRIEIKRYRRGATVKGITSNDLKKIGIQIPSLDEQKRIATILDKADVIERYVEQSQEIISQLSKGVFVDTFGDLVLNPFDYPVMKLGEICDVRDGTHDSPSYVSQGYPLITSKNLKNGSIEFDSVNLISRQDYDKINQRSKVDLGDIIMPMIGTIGGPIIVNSSREFAIKNVALIKFSDSGVSNIYVKALLESHFFDYLVNRISRGGTQKFISLKNIREFPIPVPPVEKQKEFTIILNQIQSIKPSLSLTKENSLSIAQELLYQS